MEQIFFYAENNSKINILIGDENFFRQTDLNILKYIYMGRGKLVFVTLDDNPVKNEKDILNNKFRIILVPDPKNSIYGKAAFEFISNSGFPHDFTKRLFIVKTVPQVSAYLTAKQADAGFMNYSTWLNLKNKVRNSIILNPEKYFKISISAAFLKNDSEELSLFASFLETSAAKKIITAKGLFP